MREQEDPQIIFQDESILIINKPSGWVVNDSQTVINAPILQDWLSKMNHAIAQDRLLRGGIVHRLDKETSGIIIIAKTEEYFYSLQHQFKQRLIQKKYLALAHGKFENKQGNINASVGRLPWGRPRGKFGVIPGGREAQTFYEVENLYKLNEDYFSLVKLSPKTGRTHQIRIHLKYIGHSIVSDTFYAGRKTSRKDRKWCPRLFLHASEITFTHPKTQKAVTFKAGLPSDLETALNHLELV